MAKFVVIRDKHDDTYATSVPDNASENQVRQRVIEYAQNVIIADNGERLTYWLVDASGAGFARLMAVDHSTMKWFKFVYAPEDPFEAEPCPECHHVHAGSHCVKR